MKTGSGLGADANETSPRPGDYLEEVDCPGCGGSTYRTFSEAMRDLDDYGDLEEPFASMLFQFVQCAECQTVYLRQRVVQAEISRFYEGDYHCYRSFDERGAIFKTLALLLARSKVSKISRFCPLGAKVLLDYGCGSGTWLEMMRRVGVDCRLIGTDILPEQIARVRAQGLEGHVCDDRQVEQYVAPGSVGVIHLFHVIEHLPDPIAGLRKLRDLLVPEGVVLGQTPNLASWDRKLFGRYWIQWHVPRHLVLYTPDTLRRHAEAAGFEVVVIRSAAASATNWAGSLLKWNALRRNKPFQPGLGSVYPLLTLGMIPLVLVQALMSYTSSMDFVLRKSRQ